MTVTAEVGARFWPVNVAAVSSVGYGSGWFGLSEYLLRTKREVARLRNEMARAMARA